MLAQRTEPGSLPCAAAQLVQMQEAPSFKQVWLKCQGELGHHLRLFDRCFWAHQQQPQCQVPYPPHAIRPGPFLAKSTIHRFSGLLLLRLRLLDLGTHLHLGGGVRCGADVPIISRQPNRYHHYSLVDRRMRFPVRMDSLLRAGGHDWGNGLHVGHLHLPHGRHFATLGGTLGLINFAYSCIRKPIPT